MSGINKDVVQGHWTEIKGKLRQKWGKLTDDEISQFKGSYEEVLGAIQKNYGYQKEEAKRELDTFLDDNNWR